MRFQFSVRRPTLSVTVLILVFFCSCAHRPPISNQQKPEMIFESICKIGTSVQSAQGTLWVRIESEKLKATVPANVKAERNGDLDLEVLNFFGGTEAKVEVRQDGYRIQQNGKPEIQRQGVTTWKGLPLHWASDLFLGKIPCPSAKIGTLVIRALPDNQIEVRDTAGPLTYSYLYRFESDDEKIWANRLEFKVEQDQAVIPTETLVAEFENPEAKTQSPLTWKIQSNQGSLKATWKNRQKK